MSCKRTDRLERDYQRVERTTVQRAGEGTAVPPCIVKSSSGTDAAMFPICPSSSSLIPVEGQLRDLGCPSRVKKPADTHINISSVNARNLPTLHSNEHIRSSHQATVSPASAWCEGSSHLWSECKLLHRFCRTERFPPERDGCEFNFWVNN